MDFLTLFSNLSLVVGFGIGFAYGIKKCLTTRKMLYFQMITAAIGCAAITRLYNVVVLLCVGEYEEGFNVGLVGPISCFCLLFCAEFGALDSLIDKTAKKNKRATLLAFIMPLILGIPSNIIAHTDSVDIIYRVFIFFTLIAICSASYFNFKHLILSKEGNEMFAPLRAYNALALLLETFYVLDLLFMTYNLTTAYLITNFAVLIVAVLILPVLDKGVGKWTI